MRDYKEAIQQTEEKEDQLLNLLMEDAIEQSTYQTKLKRIRDDKRRYENQLEEVSVLVSTQFYETTEKILELAKDAELLWKQRSDVEKVEFLKLILSNQRLNTSSGDKNNVSVDYDLKKPYEKLAGIKKATSKSGFLSH